MTRRQRSGKRQGDRGATRGGGVGDDKEMEGRDKEEAAEVRDEEVEEVGNHAEKGQDEEEKAEV